MKTKRILAPVDFSDHSRLGLIEADELASERGARLCVLHIHPIVEVALMDFTYIEPPERIAEVCEAAENHLKEWTKNLKTPRERIDLVVKTGAPVDEIVAESANFDLVVITTHGRAGVTHFLLGSTAERVIRASKCSVLVVKGEQP